MLNTVPLFLIFLSLVGISVVIGRKFSALANLDVDSIPEEKESKFKERMAGKRIKKNLMGWSSKAGGRFKNVYSKPNDFLVKTADNLERLKKKYAEEGENAKRNKSERIANAFRELEKLDPKEDFEACESKLIEIIGADSKNVHAFEELADLYFDNKKYKEAEQTYEHLLKLFEENKDEHKRAEIYFDLGLVAKEQNKASKALKNIQKALKLAPNNPRFLDTMIEISIINKDKTLAKSAYDKLAEVNPENKKLEEWKKKLEDGSW
ncbi:MAG: tetratricopeptide repeat protein [Patescibacteria group bacterium]